MIWDNCGDADVIHPPNMFSKINQYVVKRFLSFDFPLNLSLRSRILFLVSFCLKGVVEELWSFMDIRRLNLLRLIRISIDCQTVLINILRITYSIAACIRSLWEEFYAFYQHSQSKIEYLSQLCRYWTTYQCFWPEVKLNPHKIFILFLLFLNFSLQDRNFIKLKNVEGKNREISF